MTAKLLKSLALSASGGVAGYLLAIATYLLTGVTSGALDLGPFGVAIGAIAPFLINIVRVVLTQPPSPPLSYRTQRGL